MKRKKVNVTQVGDLTAAFRKWKSIISKGPDLMRNTDLETHGGTVFAFAHLMETRQTIGMKLFDKTHIQDVKAEQMADTLRDRHACIIHISSLNDDSISFQIYFVFNKEQTKIDNIICADLTVGMIYFLTDGIMLPTVLKKFMQVEDIQFEMPYDFSSN